MNKLKTIRIAKGLTQKELAEKAGVTRQTVSKLEREENPKAHYWTMMSIADALGGKVQDVFML